MERTKHNYGNPKGKGRLPKVHQKETKTKITILSAKGSRINRKRGGNIHPS